MDEIQTLFENNRLWAEKRLKENSEVFTAQAEKQTPKYLWIGCADSRVPPCEILGLQPGEIFVHRNIANVFSHTDLNSLSVLQYGIEYLGIEHVIVCGHYGCGGAAAAMENQQFGVIDHWLRHIRDVYYREKQELEAIKDQKERQSRLIELNVLYQVQNLSHTTVVQNAWAKQKKVSVHGWVYDLSKGRIQDLECSVSSLDQVDKVYRTL